MRSHQGFSLLEVMMVMVVAAIALMALFGSMTDANDLMDHTDAQDKVLQAMNTEVERLQLLPYNSVAALITAQTAPNYGWVGLDKATQPVGLDAPSGDRGAVVRRRVSQSSVGLLLIELDADWVDRRLPDAVRNQTPMSLVVYRTDM